MNSDLISIGHAFNNCLNHTISVLREHKHSVHCIPLEAVFVRQAYKACLCREVIFTYVKSCNGEIECIKQQLWQSKEAVTDKVKFELTLEK